MIMLKDSAILVVGQDGRSIPFEPEDLQTRIIKSCLAAGSKDVWIAQDISLSVEYALVSRTADGPATVRAAELDALVVKILEETGYQDVAERFRVSTPKGESLLDSSDCAALSDIISKRLNLSGAGLDAVMRSLRGSLKALGIERCSPQLAIELARHHKDALCEAAPSLTAPKLKGVGRRRHGEGEFIVETQELLSGLSDELEALVSAGAISIRPLSRLFPALILDLRLVPFAKLAGFEKPLTELALAPRLGVMTSAIETLAAKADALCAETGRSDCLPLPLWVNLADISEFSSAWLGYGPEGVGRASGELASMLLAPLARAPFKTTLI